VTDAPIGNDVAKFQIFFWDRIFVSDGSFLEVGGDRIPLACVFVSGVDNRLPVTIHR